MHRARARDDEQPVVGAVEHPGDLGAAPDQGVGGEVAHRDGGAQFGRGEQRLDRGDAGIHRTHVVSSLVSTAAEKVKPMPVPSTSAEAPGAIRSSRTRWCSA